MTDTILFESMNSNLTLWENTKAFFYIPNHKAFKAIAYINPKSLTYLISVYNSITDSMFIPWKGSDNYQGIPLNFCSKNPSISYSDVYDIHDKRLSYESTLAFNAYTPLGMEILKGIAPFNFVRGKIARLKSVEYIGDWHTDEDVREVMKVVIPLKTDNSYMFQLEGNPPFTLNVGQCFIFDASIPHRVLSKGNTGLNRDYLILSIPMWLDIDQHLNITKSIYYGESIPDAFYNNCSLF